jgi:ATP-dependent RNA helicase MRH4
MAILQHILKSRPQLHIIFCTATFPPSLFQTLTKAKGLKDAPFTHLLTPSLHKLPPTLETRFVPRSGSGNLFADVAHELKRVLAEDAIKRKEIMLSGQDRDKAKYVVFCNSDRNTRRLSNYMNERDLPNVAWTGDSEQRVKGKNGVLGSFLHDTSLSTKEALLPRHGSAQVPRILVTTGILSRGLDFSPLVTTVFLVDQPKDILDFVHRAGRAGRAGRKGRVVVFGMGTGRPGDAGNLGKEVASVVGTVDKTESRFGGRGQVKRSIGGRLGGRPTGRPTGRQGGRPTGRPVSRQSSAKPYAPTPSKLFGGKTRAMFGIPSKRIPRP